MQKLLDSIRIALDDAQKEKEKAATLHSLVLIHAAELASLEPLEFCRQLGIHKSYQTEFRKMLSATRVLEELGYAVQEIERN
jgi:hypothetical protein